MAAILRGRIRAKRKDYLAADINKLLRDRITEPLTIKVGNKVLAEFLRNEGRKPQAPGIDYVNGDHGWLVWPSSIYTVYVWPALAAYYAVVDGSPVLGGDNEHTPEFSFTTAPTLNPATFSGLARLFIQSIQSVGRPLTYYLSQLGVMWTGTTGKNIGLIRSPTGEYWMTRCAASGLLVAKMTVPAAYTDLAVLADSGTLSALGQRIADATILSVLELAKTGSTPIQYSLIHYSSTDWQNVYGSDNKFVEKFWGWAWKYQNRKRNDEFVPGAVIVTHKYTPSSSVPLTIEFNECNLSFTWDEAGIPSASIALTQNGFWKSFGSNYYGPRIYTAIGSTIRTMMRPAWVNSPVSGEIKTDRVVAVWWAPDATQKRIEIVSEYSLVEVGSTGPLHECCAESDTQISAANHTMDRQDYEIAHAVIAGRAIGVSSWYTAYEKYKRVTLEKDPPEYPRYWPTTSSGYIYTRTVIEDNNSSIILSRDVIGLVWATNYDRFYIRDLTETWTNLEDTGGGFPPWPACSTGVECSILTPDLNNPANYPEGGSVSETYYETTASVITIVNGKVYSTTSGSAFNIVNDMLSDASSLWQVAVTSSSTIRADVSYGNLALATGADMPIDSAGGDQTTGIWIGCA